MNEILIFVSDFDKNIDQEHTLQTSRLEITKIYYTFDFVYFIYFSKRFIIFKIILNWLINRIINNNLLIEEFQNEETFK